MAQQLAAWRECLECSSRGEGGGLVTSGKRSATLQQQQQQQSSSSGGNAQHSRNVCHVEEVPPVRHHALADTVRPRAGSRVACSATMPSAAHCATCTTAERARHGRRDSAACSDARR
eukprot:TRINITY_DN5356_c1_g1_i1.p3 TRINITY_DN5356_c1_g1~~TRINITY_DN5356_c1_g1_i1.p3  ORF type:complete len:117 (+),score=30.79 TRINITY_DN5356_c1_g1_i1:602-952(+)